MRGKRRRCSNNGSWAARVFLAWAVAVVTIGSIDVVTAAEFNRDIRPILSEKCFQCHGPDANSRESDLRLDIPDSHEGPFFDRGGYQVIQPGSLESSELWQRLTTDDEDLAMPPSGAHKDPLSAAQLAMVRQWILDGAPYEEFWAFVPPRKSTLPTVGNSDWTLNRIDNFVLAPLEAEQVRPQPRADKRTLIRRLTFDLTGLPPTRAEVHRFLHDHSNSAYERLVDRLLASPKYGEHMAKYWLDLVRFADTNGIHHDHYREMTPYRDWVIRSFNDNLAFDEFVVHQIAGDLFDNPTIDQQIASGFNRLHLVIDKGTALPEESFTRNVIDRVTAVGTAFMGLTVGCAVCHDHKYDPVTQKDFYQLYAFFNNIDAGPETPGRRVHAPFIRLPNPEQRDGLRKLDSDIANSNRVIKRLKELHSAVTPSSRDVDQTKTANAPKLAAEEATASANNTAIGREVSAELERVERGHAELVKRRSELEEFIPVSLVMKERKEVRPTHILIRGAYDQPGEQVERNTPGFLPPMRSTGNVKSRMDLARWLTDSEHPLTARVTVNRIWQQFFGVGLVRTSEDFGMQGEWPSHPRLLDDLAIGFVASGWDVKQLVKMIVSSQTYQQSSRASEAQFREDADNRRLSRGSRFRLDAEMIRDQILSVSGLLCDPMYGKSVKPPQPPNLWKTVSMVSSSTYAFEADQGAKIYRRSLYSFWKRALPPPQMTIFDAPTRESCVARRERTNTPLQALVLMNESQYFQASKAFAHKLIADPKLSERQRIVNAYEAITSRLPDAIELTRLQAGLNALRQTYRDDLNLTRAMTSEVKSASEGDRVQLAAYTMLVNSLFNLDVAKTRE